MYAGQVFAPQVGVSYGAPAGEMIQSNHHHYPLQIMTIPAGPAAPAYQQLSAHHVPAHHAHVHLGQQIAIQHPQNVAQIHKGSIPLRKGKWTPEEEEYTAKIIRFFNTGALALPEGTTLRAYLAEKLHCDPMRITKKFTGSSCLGKRVYHSSEATPASSAEIEAARIILTDLETKFWMKLIKSESTPLAIGHSANPMEGDVLIRRVPETTSVQQYVQTPGYYQTLPHTIPVSASMDHAAPQRIIQYPPQGQPIYDVSSAAAIQQSGIPIMQGVQGVSRIIQSPQFHNPNANYLQGVIGQPAEAQAAPTSIPNFVTSVPYQIKQGAVAFPGSTPSTLHHALRAPHQTVPTSKPAPAPIPVAEQRKYVSLPLTNETIATPAHVVPAATIPPKPDGVPAAAPAPVPPAKKPVNNLDILSAAVAQEEEYSRSSIMQNPFLPGPPVVVSSDGESSSNSWSRSRKSEKTSVPKRSHLQTSSSKFAVVSDHGHHRRPRQKPSHKKFKPTAEIKEEDRQSADLLMGFIDSLNNPEGRSELLKVLHSKEKHHSHQSAPSPNIKKTFTSEAHHAESEGTEMQVASQYKRRKVSASSSC